MKKLAVSLAVIVLVCISVIGFSQSSSQVQSNQEEKKPSTTPTPSPAPIATPMPAPTPTPTPDPATEGSFGPKGCFRITSPTCMTYDTGNLTLTILGNAINQPLAMSYSIDGQPNVSIGAEVKQAHDWDPFFGVINETVSLPPLANGAHSLTVYGTLAGNSDQATVHFTIAQEHR